MLRKLQDADTPLSIQSNSNIVLIIGGATGLILFLLLVYLLWSRRNAVSYRDHEQESDEPISPTTSDIYTYLDSDQATSVMYDQQRYTRFSEDV